MIKDCASIIEALNKCRTYRLEIAMLSRLIDDMRLVKYPIMARSKPTSEAGGATNNVDAKKLQNLDHLEELYTRRIENLETHIIQCEDAIWELDDSLSRTVLRLYYLQGMTIRKVSNEMDMTKGNVLRLKQRALDMLKARN